MSKWKIIRESNDPMALRISVGSPQLENSEDGYIVYRGDTKECLNLLQNAVDELKKHYEEQGTCWKQGHDWRYDSPTLGGYYIRCKRCRALEEYLPGLHEPKGYNHEDKTS